MSKPKRTSPWYEVTPLTPAERLAYETRVGGFWMIETSADGKLVKAVWVSGAAPYYWGDEGFATWAPAPPSHCANAIAEGRRHLKRVARSP